MNEAVIIFGSNIQPQDNLKKAVILLKKQVKIIHASSIWKSKSIGYDGPDFLNAAAIIHTQCELSDLKTRVLRKIENELGRTRSKNKNAPRTIDLDIVIFNDHQIDHQIWTYAFCIFPISELLPNLKHFEEKTPIDVWINQNFFDYPIIKLGKLDSD